MIPWFQYNVIKLGPISIQVWGLWVALGMILAIGIILVRAKRLGLDANALIDQALWMIVGGLIGARLFHIVFYEPAFYLQYPLEIIKVWHGGLSSFGGLIGAIIGFFSYQHKLSLRGASNERRGNLQWYKRLLHFVRNDRQVFLQKADLFSFAATFGWIVGRVGCFMIHDHLGVHSNCPLAIQTIDGPRLDMALIEIIALVPLAIFFLIHKNRKPGDGFFTYVLFIYYGIIRFVLDFWRAGDIINPDVRYLGLTPAQYFAILLVIIGGYWFVKKNKNSIKM